jgi:hypothetical protein
LALINIVQQFLVVVSDEICSKKSHDDQILRNDWISTRGNIFRIENTSVWQIPMFSQSFPMRNMGRLCEMFVKNSLLLS